MSLPYPSSAWSLKGDFASTELLGMTVSKENELHVPEAYVNILLKEHEFSLYRFGVG